MKRHTQIVMGRSNAGVKTKRFAILDDRFVQLPLILKRQTQTVVGHSEAGIDPERLAILGDRFVQLPLFLKRESQIVMGHSDAGTWTNHHYRCLSELMPSQTFSTV